MHEQFLLKLDYVKKIRWKETPWPVNVVPCYVIHIVTCTLGEWMDLVKSSVKYYEAIIFADVQGVKLQRVYFYYLHGITH